MPTDGGRYERSAQETTILLPSNPQPPQSNVLPKLITAILLFFTAVAMTIPVRPILILKATSNNPQLASYFTGTVDSLQSFLTIFTSPLLGTTSDIIGRKPILILSHLGEFIGLLAIASFPTTLFSQFPAYLIIALTNAYVTTANTIVADLSFVDTQTTARNYGYIGAAFGVCFLIGPTVGGIIEDKFYLASSFHTACVLIVLAMLFIHFFLPETNPTDDEQSPTPSQIITAIQNTQINPFPRIRAIFSRNQALTWVAIAISISSLAQSGLNSIMFLYVSVRLGWGTKEIGLFLSMVGLTVLISQALLAPASVRILGEVPTILLGYTLSAVHYIIYGLANNTRTMYIGLFIGMLSFISDPAMKGLLARQVSNDMQGALQGSISGLTTVVRPIAPILVATCFSVGNDIGIPGLPFYVVGFISFVSVGCVRIAFWKPGLK